MKFIDKLRKITNNSDVDDHLIDKCINVINELNPDMFTTIPQKVQNKLMDAARQQKHSCVFNNQNYFSFIKTYRNLDSKIVAQLKDIVQKVEYNSLFVVDNRDHYVKLNWKYLDNECEFELYNDYSELDIYVNFGLKTCAKILEKAGFDVKFNLLKQTLKVKW